MALLSGLRQLSSSYQWRLYVVHVNHQLRGQDSEEDAAYVKAYCEKWQIPCEVRRVDVLASLKSGGNRQAAARELRYQAYYEVAKHWQIEKLALAHHADDQVETILMRMIRGTGVTGLSGMEPIRKWRGLFIVRPMLKMSRAEIERYCEQENLEPRQDQSNFSLIYTRNRIRHQLIPVLKQLNPKVKEAILHLGEIVAEEEKVWIELVEDALKRVVSQREEGRICVNVQPFLELPVALQRRVVKLILSYLVNGGTNDVTLDAVERIRALAQQQHPSGMIHLLKAVHVYREYEKLWFTFNDQKKVEDSLLDISIPLSIPGVTPIPEFEGMMEAILTSEPLNKWTRNTAVFDADELPTDHPILVRSRKPGDRMSCFGMQGTKKLKKILMEAKIPRHKRHLQPVVITGDQILWVPGVQRSNIAPVSSKTTRFLYLIWHVE
ncbi:tRNA(Ile)-lysidine synthase [Thermoflavimicrobium dichotomicum]|uniref:tRNA(Ile)-lysidine synthase n=2 Tax=Thermoflavimicrobium dichotomicum TaxID=46223 RepID=A0A1I3QRX9_9BACL|nr:tRNA(Ile)-lysidine synthase [Thermoflavimicrobium dichotomicum]